MQCRLWRWQQRELRGLDAVASLAAKPILVGGQEEASTGDKVEPSRRSDSRLLAMSELDESVVTCLWRVNRIGFSRAAN
jgi:hypothetical protein